MKYTVTYSQQEGQYQKGKFKVEIKKKTHQVFADNEKDAIKRFSVETKIAEDKVTKVEQSTEVTNMIGDLCPGLFKIKLS